MSPLRSFRVRPCGLDHLDFALPIHWPNPHPSSKKNPTYPKYPYVGVGTSAAAPHSSKAGLASTSALPKDPSISPTITFSDSDCPIFPSVPTLSSLIGLGRPYSAPSRFPTSQTKSPRLLASRCLPDTPNAKLSISPPIHPRRLISRFRDRSPRSFDS